MKDFINSLKFKILVGILAFLIGIMIYSATTAGGTSFVSSFFGTIVSPIQNLSSSISNKVSTSLDTLMNAKQYRNENEELKKKLDELYIQMVDYQNIKEENSHYQEILGLAEDFPDYKISPPCKVIGRTPNDLYQSFSIDKGSRDGISLYDPVITSEGLVGIISEVQLTVSKVTTILSPEFSPGVICISTKDTGSIEGTYSFASEGYTKMKFIKRDSTMQKGDVVVTSGHSGLVPKDRIIGTVEKIEMDKSGLSLVATIKPIVSIEDLTNVFVITDFEGQGEGYVD